MSLKALVIESMSGNFEVLSRFLEKIGLTAKRISMLTELNEILSSEPSISIAIIDTMGFDDKIWEYCKELKNKDIPMLIISPSNRIDILQNSYEYGAKGIFKKPVLMQELANCIKSLLPDEVKKLGD